MKEGRKKETLKKLGMGFDSRCRSFFSQTEKSERFVGEWKKRIEMEVKEEREVEQTTVGMGWQRTRPDTRHKMRLVCVLFTLENNTGQMVGPTDRRTDGRTRPLIEMRRRI